MKRNGVKGFVYITFHIQVVTALSPYRGRSEVLVGCTECTSVPSERLRVGDRRSGMGSNVLGAPEDKTKRSVAFCLYNPIIYKC